MRSKIYLLGFILLIISPFVLGSPTILEISTLPDPVGYGDNIQFQCNATTPTDTNINMSYEFRIDGSFQSSGTGFHVKEIENNPTLGYYQGFSMIKTSDNSFANFYPVTNYKQYYANGTLINTSSLSTSGKVWFPAGFYDDTANKIRMVGKPDPISNNIYYTVCDDYLTNCVDSTHTVAKPGITVDAVYEFKQFPSGKWGYSYHDSTNSQDVYEICNSGLTGCFVLHNNSQYKYADFVENSDGEFLVVSNNYAYVYNSDGSAQTDFTLGTTSNSGLYGEVIPIDGDVFKYFTYWGGTTRFYSCSISGGTCSQFGLDPGIRFAYFHDIRELHVFDGTSYAIRTCDSALTSCELNQERFLKEANPTSYINDRFLLLDGRRITATRYHTIIADPIFNENELTTFFEIDSSDYSQGSELTGTCEAQDTTNGGTIVSESISINPVVPVGSIDRFEIVSFPEDFGETVGVEFDISSNFPFTTVRIEEGCNGSLNQHFYSPGGLTYNGSDSFEFTQTCDLQLFIQNNAGGSDVENIFDVEINTTDWINITNVQHQNDFGIYNFSSDIISRNEIKNVSFSWNCTDTGLFETTEINNINSYNYNLFIQETAGRTHNTCVYKYDVSDSYITSSFEYPLTISGDGEFVLSENQTSVISGENISLIYDVESFFDIQNIYLVHTFNGSEEQISLSYNNKTAVGVQSIKATNPESLEWKISVEDEFGNTINSSIRNVTQIYPYEEGVEKNLQLKFDGFRMESGCNNNITIPTSEERPLTFCLNNGTDDIACKNYTTGEIGDGDIIISDGFEYTRFNEYTPVIYWDNIKYLEGRYEGKIDSGLTGNGVIYDDGNTFDNYAYYFVDEYRVYSSWFCSGPSVQTGPTQSDFLDVSCPIMDGEEWTTANGTAGLPYNEYFVCNTDSSNPSAADRGGEWNASTNCALTESCSYPSGSDSLPSFQNEFVDGDIKTASTILYSDVEYTFLDPSDVGAPLINNVTISPSIIEYGDTFSITADINAFSIDQNITNVYLYINCSNENVYEQFNYSVNTQLYHLSQNYTVNKEYGSSCSYYIDVIDSSSQVNTTGLIDFQLSNYFTNINDGEPVSVWYQLDSLYMTDGCNADVSISPTPEYPLEICLNNGTHDLACRTITNQNFGFGSVFSSDVFNWDENSDYRFKLNWQRIGYLNGTNVGKTDRGQYSETGPSCLMSPEYTSCFGDYDLRYYLNASCGGSWYYGTWRTELQSLGSPIRTTENNYATASANTDLAIRPVQSIYGGTCSGCEPTSGTKQTWSYCSPGINEPNLCTHAGNTTIYTDYFTEYNTQELSTNEKIFSEGIVYTNTVVYTPSATPPEITFENTTNSNPIKNDFINLTFYVSDDTIVTNVESDGCNVLSDDIVGINSQNSYVLFELQQSDDCQLNLTVNDIDGYSNELTYNIEIEKTAQSPVAQITNKPVYDDDIEATIIYIDELDNPYNSWIGNNTRWYKDGVYQPAYDDLFSVPNGVVSDGDNWTFEARTIDTWTTSEWVSDSVIINQPIIDSWGVVDSQISTDDAIDFRISAFGDFENSACKLTLKEGNSTYNVYTDDQNDNIYSLDFFGYSSTGILEWTEIQCIDVYSSIVTENVSINVTIVSPDDDDGEETPATGGGGGGGGSPPLLSVAEDNDFIEVIREDALPFVAFGIILVSLSIIGIILFEGIIVRRRRNAKK